MAGTLRSAGLGSPGGVVDDPGACRVPPSERGIAEDQLPSRAYLTPLPSTPGDGGDTPPLKTGLSCCVETSEAPCRSRAHQPGRRTPAWKMRPFSVADGSEATGTGRPSSTDLGGRRPAGWGARREWDCRKAGVSS